MAKPYYWPAKTVPGGGCPVCGAPNPALEFCSKLECHEIPPGYVTLPHLHRACAACKTKWIERPLNSPDEPPPPHTPPPTLDEYLRSQAEKE